MGDVFWCSTELYSLGSRVFGQPGQVGLDIDTTLLGRPDNSTKNADGRQ